MISVSFFCTRTDNLDEILSTYQSYSILDEVLVVYLDNIDISKYSKYSKAKLIHMPKSADLGLLSRYTFALSCKNRFVFIQDDDHIFEEHRLKELFDLKEPITGCHPRWFVNDTYISKAPNKSGYAPIILTVGCLVDTKYLPKVISYAKDFFPNYQNVFNGEDIFMARAISKITNKQEFRFLRKGFKKLSLQGQALSKSVNSKKDRTNITKKIYDYFGKIK